MSLGELLEGQRGLRISDPRQMSIELHAHLRELIVTGVLPIGTELKQAELARLFAVSRTPLREAFRMLQEEGLVSAKPNQRSRVVGFDAEELELLYAGRVALESLGVRLTTGRMTRDETRDASAALREMERAHRAGDTAGWLLAHHRFHQLVEARCGDAVLHTISSYARRSERYVRIYQHEHPDLIAQRHQEHASILDAVRGDDVEQSVALMAQHLARTALHLVNDFTPGRGAYRIQEAVELVAGPAASDALNV